MDLHNDPAFQALNVGFVSIAFDSLEEQAAAAPEYGITEVPLLSDANGTVSAQYDVLKWAIASGEPGHTFILVDENGEVAWIRDYGAPDLPERTMYVPPPDLVSQIQTALE
ncbi:MAG: peroxiredoxin family protein [Anaerolineae bacterium]|nr:peroxiredoxin family protein [Anaerolineae bacterium]